jgi:hypothetical protein
VIHKGKAGREEWPAFRPVVKRLGPKHNLEEMANELIAYCETQLAVEFAHRYGRYFRGVPWLNAARPPIPLY